MLKLVGDNPTGGIAALLLIMGWHHYYNNNWRSGITVLEQAKAFMSVPPPQGMDDYGNLQLPLLNPVRDATLAYGDWGDRSRLADMGLYQGRRVGPYVEQTYLQLLEQRYLPALFNGLVKEMNAAPPESEEKLAVLRVIRMLEDKSGRTRTGNILRQQLSFSDTKLPLLYRTERALQLICDKLQQVELKRQPHVENLLYFVQNTRKRLEPQPKSSVGTPSQTTVRTLIYAPESTQPVTEESLPPLPDLPEMKVEVHNGTTPVASATPAGILKVLWRVLPARRLLLPHSGGGRCTRCNNNFHKSGIQHRARQQSGCRRLNWTVTGNGCNSFPTPRRCNCWKQVCR